MLQSQQNWTFFIIPLHTPQSYDVSKNILTTKTTSFPYIYIDWHMMFFLYTFCLKIQFMLTLIICQIIFNWRLVSFPGVNCSGHKKPLSNLNHLSGSKVKTTVFDITLKLFLLRRMFTNQILSQSSSIIAFEKSEELLSNLSNIW